MKKLPNTSIYLHYFPCSMSFEGKMLFFHFFNQTFQTYSLAILNIQRVIIQNRGLFLFKQHHDQIRILRNTLVIKGLLVAFASDGRIYNKNALYRGFVSAFFCPSVHQSVDLSIGPFVGPSAGWMHRCLPVRLVFKKPT